MQFIASDKVLFRVASPFHLSCGCIETIFDRSMDAMLLTIRNLFHHSLPIFFKNASTDYLSEKPSLVILDKLSVAPAMKRKDRPSTPPARSSSRSPQPQP